MEGIEGLRDMVAALKKSIAEQGRHIQRELDELGIAHKELLQTGGCPCAVPGSKERCAVADTLERGASELADDTMPAVRGSRSTN